MHSAITYFFDDHVHYWSAEFILWNGCSGGSAAEGRGAEPYFLLSYSLESQGYVWRRPSIFKL